MMLAFTFQIDVVDYFKILQMTNYSPEWYDNSDFQDTFVKF